MSFLDLLLLLIVIIFLFSTKKNKNELIFDKSTTECLRGFGMLAIIIGHICINLQYSSPILHSIGWLFTGMFFFISGYGNSLSLNKVNIAKIKWLIKKIKKIYVPFIISYIFMIFFLVCIGTELSVKSIIIDLFIISLPNTINWFPKVIIICFLVHYISKIISENMLFQSVLINTVIILYMLVGLLFKIEVMWIDSVQCYGVGVAMAYCEKNKIVIKRFIRQNARKIFIASLVITCVCTYLTSILWYFRFPFAVFFSLTCYLFTFVFCTDNRILRWIGNNSFEFYIFHIMIYKSIAYLTQVNHYLYAGIIICTTLLTVLFYSVLKKRLFMRYSKYIIKCDIGKNN